MISLSFLGVLCAVFLAPQSLPAEPPEALSESLVKLRGEVEELNVRLDKKKVFHETEVRSLQAQLAEFRAELKREKLKIEKLQASLAKQQEAVRKSGISREDLKPVILRVLNDIQDYIESSLPFKTGERLAEVNEIREQVQSDVVAPQRAVNRLWSLYEDEIRLTGENGQYRQAVVLDGEERLADVARLGMVMMFFRTSDGSYGRVVKGPDGWTAQHLTDSADEKRVAILFDSLNMRVRTGYFELPNGLNGIKIEETP